MKGNIEYIFNIKFTKREISILSSIITNIPNDILKSNKEINSFKTNFFNLLKQISDDNDLPI